MPAYHYQYTDPSGKTLEGTILANSDHEAARTLFQRGIRNARIFADPNAPPPPVSATLAPGVSPLAGMPLPTVVPVSGDVPVSGLVVRTKKASDQQRFFLFGQVAQQLKAGINPVQVFETIGRVTRLRHFRDSLFDLSKTASVGGSLSERMGRYVDLYPEHAIGMVRAGEQGGFLPEAFDKLAQQAGDAHRFKRWHWFIWYLIPRAFIAFPAIMAVRQGLLNAWELAKQGPVDSMVFARELWRAFVWPWLPLTLLLAAIALLLGWWWKTRPMTIYRHHLGLKVPVYGARARNENVAIFCWTMAKLSRAGLPPAVSWRLAAEAVPNLAVQQQLVEIGRRLHDGSKISEAIFQSGLFPDEFAPLIATGELTGDIEGSLNQLETATRGEFDNRTNRAKMVSFSLGCSFALLVSGAVIIILAWTYYRDILGPLFEGNF